LPRDDSVDEDEALIFIDSHKSERCYFYRLNLWEDHPTVFHEYDKTIDKSAYITSYKPEKEHSLVGFCQQKDDRDNNVGLFITRKDIHIDN